MKIGSYRVSPAKLEKAQVGSLYLVEVLKSYYALYVLLGFNQDGTPYFYECGGINGNVALEGINEDYLKVMKDAILQYTFSSAIWNCNVYSARAKGQRIYDLNLGAVSKEMVEQWYLKNQLQNAKLPSLKSEPFSAKPVLKKELVPYNVFFRKDESKYLGVLYLGHTEKDGYYYYTLYPAVVRKLHDGQITLDDLGIIARKTKPEWYKFEDVREYLADIYVQNYEFLGQLVKERKNVDLFKG